MKNGNQVIIKKSSRGRTPQGDPNPVDIHVGKRIYLRRSLLEMSQERFAELLGLTFQQIQKYERGMNRVGASRLWDISTVLDVPIDFFYEDMLPEVANQSPRMFRLPAGEIAVIETIETEEADPMLKTETYELVKDYYKIKNRDLAEALKETIHQAAKLTCSDEKDKIEL